MNYRLFALAVLVVAPLLAMMADGFTGGHGRPTPAAAPMPATLPDASALSSRPAPMAQPQHDMAPPASDLPTFGQPVPGAGEPMLPLGDPRPAPDVPADAGETAAIPSMPAY